MTTQKLGVVIEVNDDSFVDAMKKLAEQLRGIATQAVEATKASERTQAAFRKMGDIGRQAADAVKNGMYKAKAGVESLKNSATNVIKTMRDLAGAVSFVEKAAGGLKSAFDSAAEGAKQLAAISFFENTGKSIKELRAATFGMVSDMDLIKRSNLADSMGIDNKTFKQLAAVAEAAALKTGESFDYMFESIVKGTARSSRLLLDNLGIIVSVGEANKNFAASVGKKVEALTDEEKQLAFVNEVYRNSTGMTLELADANVKTAVTFQKLEVSITNLFDRMKQSSATQLEGMVADIEKAITHLEDILKFGGNWKEVASLIGNYIYVGIMTGAVKALKGLQSIIPKTDELTYVQKQVVGADPQSSVGSLISKFESSLANGLKSIAESNQNIEFRKADYIEGQAALAREAFEGLRDNAKSLGIEIPKIVKGVDFNAVMSPVSVGLREAVFVGLRSIKWNEANAHLKAGIDALAATLRESIDPDAIRRKTTAAPVVEMQGPKRAASAPDPFADALAMAKEIQHVKDMLRKLGLSKEEYDDRVQQATDSIGEFAAAAGSASEFLYKMFLLKQDIKDEVIIHEGAARAHKEAVKEQIDKVKEIYDEYRQKIQEVNQAHREAAKEIRFASQQFQSWTNALLSRNPETIFMKMAETLQEVIVREFTKSMKEAGEELARNVAINALESAGKTAIDSTVKDLAEEKTRAVSSTGVSIAQGAAQGGAIGSGWGAVIGAVIALFSKLLASLEPVVNLIGMIVDGLANFIELGFTEFFEALLPIGEATFTLLGVLGKIIGGLLRPIISLIDPIISLSVMFTDLLSMVLMLIEPFSELIGVLFILFDPLTAIVALFMWINTVLEENGIGLKQLAAWVRAAVDSVRVFGIRLRFGIAWILEGIAHFVKHIPFAGESLAQALNSAARSIRENALRHSDINHEAWQREKERAKDKDKELKKNTEAIKDLSREFRNLPSGFKVAAASFRASNATTHQGVINRVDGMRAQQVYR
jgi:hypothetical protein